MNNWSIDKATFNQFENAKIIGYKFICRSQAAGTNDKKWNARECYYIYLDYPDCDDCDFKNKCPLDNFDEERILFQAANTSPEFTPEQQEMIDWIDAYPYAALGFSMHPSIVKTAYKEIINKHRSK